MDEIEKHNQEEWGGWKFVSDMLDNPNEYGIYPTSKCYEQLYDFIMAQKEKARLERDEKWRKAVEGLKIQEKVNTREDFENDFDRGVTAGDLISWNMLAEATNRRIDDILNKLT